MSTATKEKPDITTDYAARAQAAINAHEAAGEKLVEVSTTLANLERERAKYKTGAILRLCQQENPATPGKNYSATQAADFAALDKDYSAYKGQVQAFTLLKLECELQLDTAKMEAAFALALFKSCGGLL